MKGRYIFQFQVRKEGILQRLSERGGVPFVHWSEALCSNKEVLEAHLHLPAYDDRSVDEQFKGPIWIWDHSSCVVLVPIGFLRWRVRAEADWLLGLLLRLSLESAPSRSGLTRLALSAHFFYADCCPS